MKKSIPSVIPAEAGIQSLTSEVQFGGYMFLLDDILLAPLKGIMALGVKLNDMINHELSDPDKIKEELMKLQLQFELDEINEQEFQRQEAELLSRLDDSENEEE